MHQHHLLSHFEPGFEKTETPQLRVNYYGAKNYGVGENVLKTSYNAVIQSKSKKEYRTFTYSELAHSIVNGWVNSPGHFKNIITPEYQLTGVSVAVDAEKNLVYACQKFARVLYQYSFRESRQLFPYSTYQPEKLVNSFEGMDETLRTHSHEWGVKHDELEKCENCMSLVQRKPPITLRYSKGSFILRIDNSEYVKQLIQNKKDGFAVEIVEMDDYMCGNPKYFTQSSRRNGQCRLNGKLLKPLYREELYKGYKKRKRNKEVTFLSYIFSADSVPFFDRFARYKIEKYSSQYFEIKLGKLPDEISGLWNHNLVYLQDDQICHVDYFTNYCGDLFEDYKTSEFLPPDTCSNYSFELDTVHYTFVIPFKKNQFDFTGADIAPFVDSLSGLDYTIDSIHIHAFSSVEGDDAVNARLQVQRAQAIAKVLEENQTKPICTTVRTATSWKAFYRFIRRSPDWRFLDSLSRKDLLYQVNEVYEDSLEFILSKGRKGIIDLYGTIDLTDRNLKHYIEKEQKWICDSLFKLPVKSDAHQALLRRYSAFYQFVYAKVVAQKVDTTVLAQLRLPKSYTTNFKLAERFIIAGYQFNDAFKGNKQWLAAKDGLRRSLVMKYSHRLTGAFIYIDCRLKMDALKRKNFIPQSDIQAILDEMELLATFYNTSAEVTSNIDRLAFNLNMLLLNRCFVDNPEEKSEEAYHCILQVREFYEENQEMNSSMALKLAKLMVHYNNVVPALTILQPYMGEESVRCYAIPLMYQHSSSPFSSNYYDQLISLSHEMDTSVWCNLFLWKCGIPFQAFDHEPLRAMFCEKCMEHNVVIRELLGE